MAKKRVFGELQRQDKMANRTSTTLVMDRDLKAKAHERAAGEGKTLTRWIVDLIRRAVGR